MFPGGRSSQNNPSGHPSSYYGNSSSVSNPDWFQPAPVPPPSQYASRAETGRDLLAESYERMRNEMRSLQGSSSSSKYGGGMSAPPAPAMEQKANPLTQLLENKDVSLSSLLEAAMDPSVGSNKRTEDPIMKKTILDKCEGKIAQLYRLRISGQGMFFPMTQPKSVKFDGVSTLTYNHPRIEFNMVPEDHVWTCPDVVIEVKNEEAGVKKEDPEETADDDSVDKRLDENNVNPAKPLEKIEVIDPKGRAPAAPKSLIPPLMPNIHQPPPNLLPNRLSHVDVSLPPLVQYPARANLSMFAQPPPNLGLPLEVWSELEKERRRKEIESEWDRLMEDKEKKEKKRKKKKRKHESRSRSSSSSKSSGDRRSKGHRTRSRSRYRSRSRGRRSSSYRRSHSRHRSRGRSRDRRHRHRSRSISFSPSPQHQRMRSPLRVRSPRVRYRRSPSPRRMSSLSPLRSLRHALVRLSPPRYQRSPPRPSEPPHHVPPQQYPYNEGPPGPPPGYNHYYNYGPGPYQVSSDPPPPGMDPYGHPMDSGSHQYGPVDPGHWGDPRFGSHMGPGGPGPWMGPGPGPRWFGPRPPMRPMPPQVPPQMHRPPPPSRGVKPLPAVKPTHNLIDLTSDKVIVTTIKTPVIVVDITDDNNKAENKKDTPKTNPKPSQDETKTAKSDSDDTKKEPEAAKPVDKAKVITNLIPPGVSPERETHTKYPNVESEFTRPMRTQFRKSLEPLDKVLDKIRLYQRDSFDFKILIKNLEAGKIEFMGVHTLHDGLLCKLEINRKQPDKFFKIVLPQTHIGRFLRVLHETYHDYPVGKVQRLIDDLFCDPWEFSLAKIVGAFKTCKTCIAFEEKEREELRKKEVLMFSSPEMDLGGDDPKDEPKVDDPMVNPRKDRHRRRSSDREVDRDSKRRRDSRRPSDGEREGKSRRDSEKDRKERSNGERDRTERSKDERGSKKVSKQKSPVNQGAETYSKYEDLNVSNDAKKKTLDSQNDESKNDKSGDQVESNDESVSEKLEDRSKDVQSQNEGDKKGQKNGKKVPAVEDKSKAVPQDVSTKSKEDSADKRKAADKSLQKKEALEDDAKKNQGQKGANPKPRPAQEKPQPKPLKPAINPDDFKERVRSVQMGVAPLCSHISDLEGLGKKSSDPALLLKAGMLCRRLAPPQGQGKPEVKIVVIPACLKQMVEIVHTMAVLHAPFQKTVTVFNKHFVPIDGLEQVVSEVLNDCAKCSTGSKN